MARMSAFLLAFFAIGACADETTSGVANLGQSGANCLRTPDCAAPLQCLGNVCSSGDAGDTRVSDATSAADSAAESRVDATTDTASEVTTDATDATAATEIAGPTDSGGTFADTGVDTDPGEISIAETNLGGDCGELGIAPAWKGTFEGAIDYDVTPNPLTPSTGTLEVTGSLGFEITCVESKFIVRGTLDGNAVVPGQFGIFPFQLTLQGHYNRETQTMTTKMIDGSVSIYGIIEVYFEGDFPGALGADGDFHGTWSGNSTGTNSTLITGTASGDGTWDASPAP